jgi:hypothetical protein
VRLEHLTWALTKEEEEEEDHRRAKISISLF